MDYNYIIDEEDFPDQSIIVKEGRQGKWIWVVLDGRVKIARETSFGPFTIALLGEGALVGSVASLFQMGYARSATVTAVGDVQLGVLDTERLLREFGTLSDDFKRLIYSVDGRLKKITDRAVSLAKKKPPVGLGRGSGQKTFVTKDGSMFHIREGTVSVAKKKTIGYLPLLSLEKGDIFGDIPFLHLGQEPRHAVVLASKDLQVTRINEQNILKEYDHLTSASKRLIESLGTYIASTTAVTNL